MSVLTGSEIIKQHKLGNIFISDFDKSRVNPNSYNLRLHDELVCYKSRYLDMRRPNTMTTTIKIPEDGYILRPNILYLGRTMEMTKTVGFAPQIQGRSSIGRLGIDVHKTAGWGDNGFENYWTLEIVVTMPVKIYPFVNFCQIVYMTLSGDQSIMYKGKYQKTNTVNISKIYEEFKK